MLFELKMKVAIYICLLCASGCVYASSYSSNFSLNDETLDFAHNAGYLESSSYNMDLSGIFWTDRIAESTSFTVIDANSDLDGSVPPPPPPPPPPGGGGPDAGGRPDYDDGEKDVAIIGMLPQDEPRPDLDLHGAAEEESQLRPSAPVFIAPVPVIVPYAKPLYDDFDGCSAEFELKYMDTNPYLYDTDEDGIGDCDEDWVYGTNPIIWNENFIKSGIAKAENFIYTQPRPLLVGRADFGIKEAYLKNHVQLGIELVDPRTEIGMFFLELKEDLNFVGILDVDFVQGFYESVLYRNGSMQEVPDKIEIDLEIEYESLEVELPDDGILNHENGFVYISGKAGSEYGVVALWMRDEYVDVSAVVADLDGKYVIDSPKQLKDGDYTVYLYSIYQEEGKFVQTNYHVISMKMEKGIPYILEESVEFFAPIFEKDLESMHLSADVADSRYMLLSGIFFAIIITSYFLLWHRRN